MLRSQKCLIGLLSRWRMYLELRELNKHLGPFRTVTSFQENILKILYLYILTMTTFVKEMI